MSSLVSSRPVCHVTPLRRWNVTCVKSALTSQLSASAGWGCSDASRSTRRSKIGVDDVLAADPVPVQVRQVAEVADAQRAARLRLSFGGSHGVAADWLTPTGRKPA